MEKRPGALRTIGEVSQQLGIRQHVLRYWETQFPMLRPVKRSGSRRYYRADDIHLLTEIDRLVHREGYTLKGARLLLERENRAATKDESSLNPQAAPSDPELSVRDSLKQLRDRLAKALELS